MKKILFSLICGIIVLGVATGCGKQMPEENLNNDKINNIESNNNEQSTTNIENWGVQENIVARKNSITTTAWIKFPTLSGIVRGTGKIAYQKDKTLVILDAERETGSPALIEDNIENTFPSYFEQTKAIIDAYREMNYDNFDFQVNQKEKIKINDYEMVKFTGKHTYTFKDINTFEIENVELNFVAYATKLKSNDAVVYWMVIDESEEQTLMSTIEEYSKNMAYSLHE